MIITDEMIKDLLDAVSYSDEYFDAVKDDMRNKGYEVEEVKSKLELAREFNVKTIRHRPKDDGDWFDAYFIDDVLEKIDLYEEAIKEKQVDADLIEWLDGLKKDRQYNFKVTELNNMERLLKQLS